MFFRKATWSVHGCDVIPAELFETLRVDQKLKKQEAHAAETLMHHDFSRLPGVTASLKSRPLQEQHS